MKRWDIDAPASSQYHEAPDGEWVEYRDVEARIAELERELAAAREERADLNLFIRRNLGAASAGAGDTEAENRALRAAIDAAVTALQYDPMACHGETLSLLRAAQKAAT